MCIAVSAIEGVSRSLTGCDGRLRRDGGGKAAAMAAGRPAVRTGAAVVAGHIFPGGAGGFRVEPEKQNKYANPSPFRRLRDSAMAAAAAIACSGDVVDLTGATSEAEEEDSVVVLSPTLSEPAWLSRAR